MRSFESGYFIEPHQQARQRTGEDRPKPVNNGFHPDLSNSSQNRKDHQHKFNDFQKHVYKPQESNFQRKNFKGQKSQKPQKFPKSQMRLSSYIENFQPVHAYHNTSLTKNRRYFGDQQHVIHTEPPLSNQISKNSTEKKFQKPITNFNPNQFSKKSWKFNSRDYEAMQSISQGLQNEEKGLLLNSQNHHLSRKNGRYPSQNCNNLINNLQDYAPMNNPVHFKGTHISQMNQKQRQNFPTNFTEKNQSFRDRGNPYSTLGQQKFDHKGKIFQGNKKNNLQNINNRKKIKVTKMTRKKLNRIKKRKVKEIKNSYETNKAFRACFRSLEEALSPENNAKACQILRINWFDGTYDSKGTASLSIRPETRMMVEKAHMWGGNIRLNLGIEVNQSFK
jgi:hypothetical protein